MTVLEWQCLQEEPSSEWGMALSSWMKSTAMDLSRHCCSAELLRLGHTTVDQLKMHQSIVLVRLFMSTLAFDLDYDVSCV